MTSRPHDALFKSAFENPEDAAALARCHLSASTCAAIRWSTMTAVPGSFVDAELADRHSDLLFKVDTEIGDAFLYLLFEHRSTPHPRMPLCVLIYATRIWERHHKQHPDGPLPAIIPLVICHAREGWTTARCFHDLFVPTLEQFPEIARFVPDFEMIVDDLTHVSNEDLRDRALAAFPKLALWLLRDARLADRFMSSLPAWAGMLVEATRTDSGLAALRLFIRYLSLVAEQFPWDDFRARIHELAPEAEQEVMTAAELLTNRGIDKGLARGRAEMLSKQLTLKFGELSEHDRARLEAASVDELDAWAMRVLTATTLDQVFGV
jgi:predicted transposase/invertase (TIGR01784 family)